MPFTTVAFGDVAAGPLAVLTPLNAHQDAHVTFFANLITVPPEVSMLAGIYGTGATIAAARVQSPSLLAIMAPDVDPLDVGAVPADPSAFVDMMENPIPLAPSEQIQGLVINAGLEIDTVGVWLADKSIVPYRGPYTSLAGVSAVANVANTWTAQAMVWGQVIPAGTYAVVGLKAESATDRLARLVFPAGAWRPGVVGGAGVAIRGTPRHRFGNAGIFGQFRHDQPPQVEYLSVLADVAEAAVLDVVKIA